MVRGKVMVVGALAVGGCSFQAQGGGSPLPGDGGVGDPDASDVRVPDAMPTPDAMPCLGFTSSPWLFDSCDLPDPTGADFTLTQGGDYDVDTDEGTIRRGNNLIDVPASGLVPQRTPGAPTVFVIAAADLTLGANVRLIVRGSHPLALVATGTLDLAGQIRSDANGAEAGGGADRAWCEAVVGNGAIGVTEPDADGDDATSGGGGGGLATTGGAGGIIADPAAAGGDPSAGGAAVPGLERTLRGGCWGGDGGAAGDGGGTAGAGGGGVALIAVERVSVTGRATVGGGGGGGADRNRAGGGGGGGSGGMLWLIAPTVAITGKVTANGGGGGEGGQDSATPRSGEDGHSAGDVAIGGRGRDGGDGGDGTGLIPGDEAGDGQQCAANVWNWPCGGGGGGGGAGYLYVRATNIDLGIGAIASPGLTNVP